MDDLDRVPNAAHAAILRSPLAHARIARLDVSGALELRRRDRRAHRRRRRARALAALPVGVGDGIPFYAAAHDVARYVGEPLAVVVARDRYVAEDALELIEVDYEPLDRRSLRSGERRRHEASAPTSPRTSFSYGDPDAAFARGRPRRRERFRFPRWSCTPVECYGVVADWDEAAGALTAWANFQGPFTLHSVAAASLGLPGSKLRLDHAAELGRQLRHQVDRLRLRRPDGLASRKLGVPVRWTEDRLEHLAGELRRDRADDRASRPRSRATASCSRCATTPSRTSGAYVRAPEPATLYRMHGSLSGAYRVQDVAVRNRVVLTNRCPTGLNRGFGGPQLYFALERTMAIAARRLGLDPAELARRNLMRADADSLPRRRRRPLRLRRLRGAASTTRCALAGYDERRAEQARRARRGPAVRRRPRLRRRAVDLEHGLHHARPDRRGARARPARSRGNAEGATVAIVAARRGHGALRDDAAGPGARDRLRADRRRRARRRPGRRRRARPTMDTADERRGRSPRATTRRRFSGVGAGAVHRAAEQLAAGCGRSPRTMLECDADDVELARAGRACVGDADALGLAAAPRRRRALGSRVAARRDGAGPARDRDLHARRTGRAGRRRPRQLVGARTASSPTSPSSRSTATTGEVEGARLRDGARRRPHPQPADRRRPDPRRLRARRSARRCFERAPSTTRTATCSRRPSWTTCRRPRPELPPVRIAAPSSRPRR